MVLFSGFSLISSDFIFGRVEYENVSCLLFSCFPSRITRILAIIST